MLKFCDSGRDRVRWGVIGILAAALCIDASSAWADEAGGGEIAVPSAAPTEAEPTEDPTEDGWQFELAPYAWFTFIDGTITFRDMTSDVSLNFDDVWKQLHFAVFLDGDIRKGNFGFFSDLTYSYLWQRTEQPLLTFSSKIRMVILDFAFYYEALALNLGSGDQSPRLRLQPFVGGRYVYMGVPTTVHTPVGDRQLHPISNTAAPILGLRAFLDIDDHWNMSFIGDGGGFGVDGMDVTWQAELLAGYRWHRSKFDFNLMVGYKGLGIDETDDQLDTDLVQHGPVLKLGFEF